jgi:hypothetical protein
LFSCPILLLSFSPVLGLCSPASPANAPWFCLPSVLLGFVAALRIVFPYESAKRIVVPDVR